MNAFVLLIIASSTPSAYDENPGWHLILEQSGERTAVRMSDGNVSEVKVGSVERAVGPNMAGATRTIAHALSPDGKRIVYELEGGKSSDRHYLAIADADGKNFRLLTNEGHSVCPAWSPDSKHIAFLGARPVGTRVWNVYKLDVDEVKEKQISRDPVSRNCKVCFAADGRLIYANERGRDGKMPVRDLVISDGQKETVLVPKNCIISASTTSNGERLAVVVPGELSIRELKADQVRKFTMKEVNPNWQVTYSNVLWRPDGKALAVTFDFLGGRQAGARIEGDDHVAVLFLDKPASAIKTYKVGEESKLLAWATDEDLKRKK